MAAGALEDAVITQEHKDRNKQDDAHGCPGQLGNGVGSRNRSASTFSTAFSRHVGQPPGRYARQRGALA